MIPTYVAYQCSVCRRIKDVLQDNVRAAPNLCTITKGCLGNLFPIGTTSILTPTSPVDGLTNWYPRGENQTALPLQQKEQLIPLSNSSGNLITLALYLDDAVVAANPEITLNFSEQLSQNVAYQQFTFATVASTAVITGQDSTGKNLLFSSSAITNNLVFVLVNGVARFPGTGAQDIVLSPNNVTFNTPLVGKNVVGIQVFSAATVIAKTLTFAANTSPTIFEKAGAWNNIRWVREYDINGNLKSKRWWLYSCLTVNELPSGARLILNDISGSNGQVLIANADLNLAIFLISAPPNDNPDRLLNFFIDCSVLAESYLLLSNFTTSIQLLVDGSSLTELYPPFLLVETTPTTSSSYIVADTFPTSDGIASTTVITPITGSKILGPT